MSLAPGASDELRGLLREARARRRISQWDLSLELGVSQRHLSFVESGRSRPGRELLLRWLAALEVPLVVRNEALLLAGHAPAYDESPLGDEAHVEARAALAHLLRGHDPWPGFVLDAAWNVVAANTGAARLLAELEVDIALPGPEGAPGAEVQVNLLDLALGPLALRLLNLPEVARALVRQLRDEATLEPALGARVELVSRLVADLPPPAGPRFPTTLVTRYAARSGEIALLSMFTTFGTPHSVTLASLRAELMFPADDATRALFGRVPAPGPGVS